MYRVAIFPLAAGTLFGASHASGHFSATCERMAGNPEVTQDRPGKLTVNAANSSCREYSGAASTLQRQRFHRNIRAAAAKYPLATLLESVAATVLHHLFQQAPHRSYPIHQTV